MNKSKSTRGITLVALIITIIVLLILAVVAIAAVNDGGIIQKTQDTKSAHLIAQEKEEILLAHNGWSIQKHYPNNEFNFKTFMENELVSKGIATGVEGNENGPLTITMKSENVYVVDENGNITKQDDDKNDSDDKIIDDFEIAVEQTLNGSPVNSVTLSIRPTIPDSWKKTEFTEEEAVAVVNGATLQLPNVTSLEDFDRQLYNFINDMPGTPINGETDIGEGDFNALKTVISSKITLGEDPKNEIFSYLMSLAGLNYSTVYVAATDMYEYKPTTYSVKIRKNGKDWVDITNESDWSYTTYQATSNGNYEIQMELDDKKSSTNEEVVDCSNLGKYVKYDANGDGKVDDETILWRVLRDDKDKVELISASALGDLNLSSTKFDEAKTNYNNVVDLLVEECEKVTGITQYIRNVGGPEEDITTMDDTVDFEKLAETTEFSPSVSITEFDKYEGTTNGLKVGDEEELYLDDYNQMQKSGTLVAYDSNNNVQKYLLACRFISICTSQVDFSIYCDIGRSIRPCSFG